MSEVSVEDFGGDENQINVGGVGDSENSNHENNSIAGFDVNGTINPADVAVNVLDIAACAAINSIRDKASEVTEEEPVNGFVSGGDDGGVEFVSGESEAPSHWIVESAENSASDAAIDGKVAVSATAVHVADEADVGVFDVVVNNTTELVGSAVDVAGSALGATGDAIGAVASGTVEVAGTVLSVTGDAIGAVASSAADVAGEIIGGIFSSF